MPNKPYYFSKGNAHIVIIISIVVGLLIVVAFVTGVAKLNINLNKSNNISAPSSSESKTQPNKKDETVLYENDEYAFALKYPESWTVKKGTTSDPAVTFISKRDSAKDTFNENIFVTVSNMARNPGLSSSDTMSIWVKENKSGEYGSTFDIASQKSIMVDGLDAEQLIYTFTASSIEIKGMITVVMKDDKAYLLSYTAETQSFDTFAKEVNTIINSFVFKR